MRVRKAIGLLFAALIVLNTCQLQFNKSSGSNVALRVVVPGGLSGGGKSAPGSKSLANGTSLTVTISQEGTSFSTQQTVPINGNSSIDLSFSLSSSGVYDVLAEMKDGTGTITLAHNTTKLTIPSGNYPVVLTMYSNLLLNVVFADSNSPPDTIATGLIPPPFTYTMNAGCDAGYPPLTLTLTAVDPEATIISVTESWLDVQGLPQTAVDSHTGSTYTLADTIGSTDTVTILVQGKDGATQTYTLTINYSCG